MKTQAELLGIDIAMIEFGKSENYDVRYDRGGLAKLMKRLVESEKDVVTTTTLRIWSNGFPRNILDALKGLEKDGYLTREKVYVNSWKWKPTEKLIKLFTENR